MIWYSNDRVLCVWCIMYVFYSVRVYATRFTKKIQSYSSSNPLTHILVLHYSSFSWNNIQKAHTHTYINPTSLLILTYLNILYIHIYSYNARRDHILYELPNRSYKTIIFYVRGILYVHNILCMSTRSRMINCFDISHNLLLNIPFKLSYNIVKLPSFVSTVW